MSAQKVLDRLEAMGILDPKVIGELRRFLEEAKYTVTPEAIVKLLVDKRQLTPFQAKKLITDVYEAERAEKGQPPAAPLPTAVRVNVPKPPAAPKPASDDDELQLADEPTKPPAAAPPRKPSSDDDVLDLEQALPPTPETPIKATIKSTPAPSPALDPDRKKVKRAPTPVPPKTVTTDDLLAVAPVPQRPAEKPAAPPAKKPPVAEIDQQTVPGLVPIDTPPPPLHPAKSTTGNTGLFDTPGLAPLTPLGPPASSGPSPLGSMNDPLAALGPDILAAPPPPPPEPEKPKLTKKKAGAWDSALMMVGGGLLGVLLITFVILYFALLSVSSSEVFDSATEAYKGGQYPTAQLRYDEFVKKFPKDPNVSIAKVRIGMSKFRQVYDGVNDYTQALKIAKEVLPTIENEKNFDDTARPDLAVILPNIADSFATKAKEATEMPKMQRFVELANEAMTLVNNPTYLPSSRRKDQQLKIDEILEKIRVAERAIHQDQALLAAIKRLDEKLSSGDTLAAYEVRDELLRLYPVLETHPEVVRQTVSISKKEGEIIAPSELNQSATNTERFAIPTARVALAKRKGANLPNVDPALISPVLVRGAAYGIEVASGKVKWRRYVGAETKIMPLVLPNGDFLLADERANDLIRIARDTGKLVWRQVLDEPFSTPAVRGEQIIVSLRSGRLAQINWSDGVLVRTTKLPQKLTSAAGIDAKGNRLLQVADRSTLFQLSLAEAINQPLTVTETYHLGHKPGTVVVPPVVVMGYVFICENAGADFSRLHMLGQNEEGKLAPLREPLRMRGRVVVPASTVGKRLVVMTDLGELLVFTVDPSNAANPVSQSAKLVGNFTQSTWGYHALDGNKLIVAEKRFTEYEILATRETLDRKRSSFDGDTFLGPLQSFGRNMVHVRQRANTSAVTVTGVNLDNPAQTWQLDLATPNAASFAFPEKKLFTAINMSGDLFEVAPEEFKEGWREQPTESASAMRVERQAVPLTKNRFLLREASGNGWLLYSPGESPRLRMIETGEEPVASTTLVPFGEGVLAASNSGVIRWLDPATGKPLRNATPFQPPLGPDAKIRWLPPQVVDDRQFLAINADMKILHLVRREDKPELFLTESRKMELDREPLSAAVAGSTLLLAMRGEQGDELRAFSLPALESLGKLALENRLTSRGIEVVGTGFACETSRGELLRLNAQGELTWVVNYADTPLVGTPVLFGSDWLVVGQAGKMSVVKADTGEMQPANHVGEPLQGTPQVFGTRVMVSGFDGTLHILPIVPPAEPK
jgi:outer membrane protein assembly factor BamB